jgi:hypothetical protein
MRAVSRRLARPAAEEKAPSSLSWWLHLTSCWRRPSLQRGDLTWNFTELPDSVRAGTRTLGVCYQFKM